MIKKLSLLYFRSYINHSIDTEGRRCIYIHGQNGSGKTSILEAISLFLPGRGLRNASPASILHHGQNISKSWAVSAELMDGELLTTGLLVSNNSNHSRRIFKLNEVKCKALEGFYKKLRIIWLTPQMDRIFEDAQSTRRKLLDRMAYNFFPEHAMAVKSYEYFVTSRNKLLETKQFALLDQLERQIAAACKAVVQHRIKTIARLSGADSQLKLNIEGPIYEAMIKYQDEFQEWFGHTLKVNRNYDAAAGRMKMSASKMDFNALHPIKAIPASLCSTGEQKRILSTMILAQARAVAAENASLIVLLDDILEHIDNENREEILSGLWSINAQIWVSGINDTAFLHAPDCLKISTS